MVFFNYALRKLNAKIVYYGPGLCGKTTNLVWIHDHFEGGERGKMISLATEGDRTIFFDLLPIEIGSIRGMDVTLQLYTVPGQVHYNSTRQLVLRGADGVVFVGDSQQTMQSSNIESFKNLQENLLLQGISLDGFPHVLQFNKRDLGDIVQVEELDDDLNAYRAPIFEAVATDGIGVQETLEGIVKLVMRSLRERYEGAVAGARIPDGEDPAVSRSPVAMPEPAPGPMVVPTPESPPVAPPPVGEIASPELGAETVSLSETYEAETFDGMSSVGFEDEISTGVYDLGEEESGALENLDLSAQLDMQPEEPEPPVASIPEFDMGGAAIDATPPPSAFEADDELFTDGPSDSGMMTPDTDDVTTVEGMKIPDFELDVASDDIASEFEFTPMDAESEIPEFEEVTPRADPEIPEFEAVTPPAEREVPEFEEVMPPAEPGVPEFGAVMPPAEPEVPDYAAAESLSVEPEASDLEVMPPVTEPEFPEIEIIPAPEEDDAAPPSERYEDRIEAAGPFAPHPQEPAGAEDVPQVLDVDEGREAEIVADFEPVETVADVEVVETMAEVEPADIAVDVEAVEAMAEVEPADIAVDVELVETVADDFEPVETEADVELVETVADDIEPVETEADVEPVEIVADDFEPVETVADVEPVEIVEPVAEIEPAGIAADMESAFAKTAAEILGRAGLKPIEVGVGEPWSEEDFTGISETAEAERIGAAAIEPAPRREIAVRAEDNQLHLRLHGTGAIIESGQMRELDIEVPVPGSWVGNRRVTLQLRLTLTPDTEDENGGSGSPS
jgi:signal recognition particle receptor subunit beta